MTSPADSPEDQLPESPESPATWENVVVGKAKEAIGHVLHDKELVEEGEDQVEDAHEVREEFRGESDRHF
jgi:uncharacterized protein YjbJ (UPF0337 family)